MKAAPFRLRPPALCIWILILGLMGASSDRTVFAQVSGAGERPARSGRLPQVARIDEDGGIVLKVDEREERTVTLIGVEWPVEEYADALHDYLEHLLLGEAVIVDEPAAPSATSKPAGAGNDDRGDESPKAVYLRRAPDRLFVNIEVLRLGYARVLAKPSFAQLGEFRDAEKKARDTGKGVWADGGSGVAGEGRPEKPIRAEEPKRNKTNDDKPEDVGGKKSDGKTSDTVFVTPSGKKYHKADCRFAAKGKGISLDEAIKKGYQACSRCKPSSR